MDRVDEEPPQLTKDPVCGREIAAGQALLLSEHGGALYPFCSEHCRMLFSLDPERYTQGKVEDRSRSPR